MCIPSPESDESRRLLRILEQEKARYAAMLQEKLSQKQAKRQAQTKRAQPQQQRQVPLKTIEEGRHIVLEEGGRHGTVAERSQIQVGVSAPTMEQLGIHVKIKVEVHNKGNQQQEEVQPENKQPEEEQLDEQEEEEAVEDDQDEEEQEEEEQEGEQQKLMKSRLAGTESASSEEVALVVMETDSC